MVLAMGGALYLGLAGGHSAEAWKRVPAESSAVMGLISDGDSVELGEFAVAEGRTIFEFTASWCGACRRMAPQLEEAATGDADTFLRVINIGSWESPVAVRYGIRSVPYLVLYEDGECVATGTAAVLARLEQ
jgi:thioredoxin 1